jgi:predicted NodU family carbamoyl transferase
MLLEMGLKTGLPIFQYLISINENSLIVNRLEETLDCFLRTRMDVFVLGSTVVEKN